jgi:hypothetical protein
MGGEDQPEPARMLANRHSSARTVDSLDASPLATPAGSQISQGFLGQPIQYTVLKILLKLPIPIGSVEALEPSTELGAFE